MAKVGIPIKALHDAEGHTVTVELIDQTLYRGTLDQADDNMNLHLSNVTATRRDGSQRALQNVFLRGSRVRFVVLPDILKHAPFFKRIETKRTKRADAKER